MQEAVKEKEASECSFKPRILDKKMKASKIDQKLQGNIQSFVQRQNKAREEKYSKQQRIQNEKFQNEAIKGHLNKG